MTPLAGEFGQGDLPVDHDRLGCGGYTLQSEPGRNHPFVHDPAGQGPVLAVADHHQAEIAGVLQRPAHQLAVLHRPAIIGHGDRTGRLQLAKLSQLVPLAAFAHRAHRIDPHRRLFSPRADHRRHRGTVIHRRGVGHAGNGGEAPRRRSPRPGQNVFFVFLPGFTQMDMHVGQSGHDPAARGIDLGRVRRGLLAGRSDAPGDDQQVAGLIDPVGRVDDAAVCYAPVRLHRSFAFKKKRGTGKGAARPAQELPITR